VIEGPDPVSARRQQVLHSRTDACDNSSFVVLGPEQRRNFVARWLGIDPDEIPWKSESTGEIVYRSDEQFYAEMRQLIAREQEKYRSTGRALVTKNLMTASEQEESIPSIDLAFDDRRGPNARWISDPNPLSSRVNWPSQPKHRYPSIDSH
jgi:hypothetical protein